MRSFVVIDFAVLAILLFLDLRKAGAFSSPWSLPRSLPKQRDSFCVVGSSGTTSLSSTSSTGKTDAVNRVDPSEMKLRDIQAELKSIGVSYADCFDRESLTRRLLEARSGVATGGAPVGSGAVEDKASTASDAVHETRDSVVDTNQSPAPQSSVSSFDREATLDHLRSLRVKELRTECAKRNIRWANMVEKEDLVKAVLQSMQTAANFSPSGALTPGQVADINADELTAELTPGAVSTPLLLDVYATWCGFCQMMAAQMVAAASELGDSVRVAKIDSDKYPAWASRLRVGGLPTVIVFDGTTGKELQRVEGALMKDELVQLVRSHL